jgi:hypothetical protein
MREKRKKERGLGRRSGVSGFAYLTWGTFLPSRRVALGGERGRKGLSVLPMPMPMLMKGAEGSEQKEGKR